MSSVTLLVFTAANSLSNLHLGCNMNKTDDLVWGGHQRGWGTRGPGPTNTQLQCGVPHLAAQWSQHVWIKYFSFFAWKEFISNLCFFQCIYCIYVREGVDVGLECCCAVGTLMTVKYIYSPLKLLHHRELQNWPSGIGGYAFHVFSQWSRNTHTHTIHRASILLLNPGKHVWWCIHLMSACQEK